MENKIIENAELVEIKKNEGKIIFTFLKDDMIYEVNWNQKAYDPTLNSFVESEQKEAQVEEWCERYFGCPSDELESQLGTKHTVYVYDTYASLWESENRFSKEDNGKSFRTEIEDIAVTDTEIKIYYRWKDNDNKKFSSKKGFTQKVGDAYYLNPMRKRKQIENFERDYGVSIDEAEKAIGHEILVKVKCAFGKHYYGEVQPL